MPPSDRSRPRTECYGRPISGQARSILMRTKSLPSKVKKSAFGMVNVQPPRAFPPSVTNSPAEPDVPLALHRERSRHTPCDLEVIHSPRGSLVRSINVVSWSAGSASPQPLRVLHVALSLHPGGTERLVIDVVQASRARGIEPVVCCLDDAGAWATEVERLGVPVIPLGRKPGFRLALCRDIARIVSTHTIGVIHCHHYSPFVYAQLAALKSGTPVVFTEHGRLSDSPPSLKRRLVNPLLGRLPREGLGRFGGPARSHDR